MCLTGWRRRRVKNTSVVHNTYNNNITERPAGRWLRLKNGTGGTAVRVTVLCAESCRRKTARFRCRVTCTIYICIYTQWHNRAVRTIRNASTGGGDRRKPGHGGDGRRRRRLCARRGRRRRASNVVLGRGANKNRDEQDDVARVEHGRRRARDPARIRAGGGARGRKSSRLKST